MSGFLDAVIVDGPNKGKTVRECLASGWVCVDPHSDAQRLSERSGDKTEAR